MTEHQDWVKIERTFAAPIEKVWDMWAKPELFASWYGPNGMTIPVAEMDVKVGGTRKICMEMATPERTMQMWFTGVYKEITPHTRLVYTESMCDADGTLIPPSAMGMPEGILGDCQWKMFFLTMSELPEATPALSSVSSV